MYKITILIVFFIYLQKKYIMKKCFKCNLEKPINEYYVHKQMADGHLNKCKECTKKDTLNRLNSLKNNSVFIEKERERSREKYFRLGCKHKYIKEINIKTVYKYREKYPEKAKAAIKVNGIKLQKGLEKHHWSYNDVHLKDYIELNRQDHRFIHRYIIYDKNTYMYKSCDGELLDTKEKHIEYINNIFKTKFDSYGKYKKTPF